MYVYIYIYIYICVSGSTPGRLASISFSLQPRKQNPRDLRRGAFESLSLSLSLYMYVYIYIYICIYIYVYIYIYIQREIYTYIHICVHIYYIYIYNFVQRHAFEIEGLMCLCGQSASLRHEWPCETYVPNECQG